jgi:hypothetical protein
MKKIAIVVIAVIAVILLLNAAGSNHCESVGHTANREVVMRCENGLGQQWIEMYEY